MKAPPPNRDRLMLAGMLLSKFSAEALDRLGFSSLWEAYNAMAYALGGKPTAIKNYRQEFDPLFPNSRTGWAKRPVRPHCREAFERFGQLGLDELVGMLSPFLPPLQPVVPPDLEELSVALPELGENPSFARRLITGVAAERFFEEAFPGLFGITS